MLFSDSMLCGVGSSVYISPTFLNGQQADGATASLTVTKPTGVVSGSFMFAFCYSTATGGTWTAPAGWTPVASVNAVDSVALFKKIAGGSEPANYSFGTGGATSKRAMVLAYQGATTVSANNLAGASFATADPQVASSLGVAKDRILLAITGIGNSSATLTTGPSGMTSRVIGFTGGAPRVAIFDLVNPSSGASGTKSFDLDSAYFGTAFLVEIE